MVAVLAARDRLGRERRREGGYRGMFEGATDPSRFVETFLLDSWREHLRQHGRVTNPDRVLQIAGAAFPTGRYTEGHAHDRGRKKRSASYFL